VSNGVVRVLVLPRELASGITVFAVSRACWAIAATVLLLTIPELIDYLGVDPGIDREDMIIPVGSIVLMLAALGVVMARPQWWTLLLYILIGSLCVYEYTTTLLLDHPTLMQQGNYMLNRPALALVLVGTTSRRARDALLWSTGAYIAAQAVTISAFARDGHAVQFGLGPTLAWATEIGLFIALALTFIAQRGRRPDLGQLKYETRQLEADRLRQKRNAALLHDTVLSDLAIVINGPAKLDDRARERIRTDVAALSSMEDAVHDVPGHDPAVGTQDRLMQIVSDYRWRGLTVELTGDTSAIFALSFEGTVAALGAVRACLENVLNHSGTTTAEIIVDESDTGVTVMIVDSGSGFDPHEIGDDRLGVRASIIQRVEAVGGYARVWSTPGNGTSVLISMPAQPRGSEEAESRVLDDA
jgi:signal transduction histidine kinase